MLLFSNKFWLFLNICILKSWLMSLLQWLGSHLFRCFLEDKCLKKKLLKIMLTQTDYASEQTKPVDNTITKANYFPKAFWKYVLWTASFMLACREHFLKDQTVNPQQNLSCSRNTDKIHKAQQCSVSHPFWKS